MYHLTPDRVGMPRLLVLEDVEPLRIAVMRLLEPFLQMDLVGISSLATAREAIQIRMPAAILLDLLLTNENGVEEHGTILIREIRSQGWPIRIIVWTGMDACSSLVREAVDLRPDAFLTKPQSVTELIAAILPAESGHSFDFSYTAESSRPVGEKVGSEN